MVTYPDGYYDRFDPTKNYDRHLYRAGRVVQGAELNETQLAVHDRIKRISDVLFKDGAVIRDAGIIVNNTTGYTQLAAGVIYARGAMRGVAPLNVTLPINGTVVVGIYLQDTVITELEDAGLRDPAIALRNFSEPGAARLKVEAKWGVAGDGTQGDFYPIYTVIDGEVQTTEPPPQIDAVSLSIAAYDRDSTGGYYVVAGLDLSMLDDDVDGRQVYSLSAGNARVNGRQVLLQHARRIPYTAVPDLKQVLSEPHNASGGTERVNLNHWPIDTVDQILITAQKTVVITHGAFNGVSDILPDTPVVQIIGVNQGGTWGGSSFTGGTTYTVGADYNLSSDSVSWSPAGAEPAPGSTYTVVYRYYAVVTPTSPDSKGFSISGAVAGTTIQVSYRWRRPRIDKLCIDPLGQVVWVNGVPNDVTPRAPAVPAGLLALANVNQTWDVTRSVVNERTQVQSMAQIQGLEVKVDNLFAVVSEHQLRTEAALSDPTTKRGIFVDNFNDDDQRDQGTSQNAAIIEGALTLPAINVTILSASLSTTQTLPLNNAGTAAVISQTLRTGCLAVNPYMAFNPIPASCHIEPATDFWTDTQSIWLSPTTRRFTTRREVIDRLSSLGWLTRTINVTTEVLVTSQTEIVSTRTVEAEFLRQIVISFQLAGFGSNEVLTTVKFDGISVAFTS
jgi:hypothetical protein